MANRRMISKSISVSRKLTQASDFEALLFTWLIPHCDDWGRMDATPQIVKGIVIPIRNETVEDVKLALEKLNSIGLIQIYDVKGESYLQIVKWDEHQTFRTDRPRIPKYPAPNGEIPIDQDNPSLIAEVYRRDGYKCRYCGAENTNFEIDHIVPRIAGGEDTLENLVVACRKCNQKKKGMSLADAGMTIAIPKTDTRRHSSKQVKVSKENRINYLEAVPREDIDEWTKRFVITEKEIKSIAEDLRLYCERKGKTYKNYKAFLLNAIKRDHKERSGEAGHFSHI